MSFHYRKIRKTPQINYWRILKKGTTRLFNLLKKTNKKQCSYAVGFVLIFIAFFVVSKAMSWAYQQIQEFDPKNIVFALGEELEKDENGYTNFVLLGDGGHVRDGADLVDTIMVASIDYKKKSISLLSIPRDYHPQNYDALRINEIYRNYKYELGEEAGYAKYMEVAGEIVDLEIQYYARVDFNAFVEIVDSLGGITVDVKESIYDPYYPNETDDGYQTFTVDAGPQDMDGETALKFVRSRKTTSDYDRAARQQLVLQALYDKGLSKQVLTNANTIKKIYESIKSNINTNLQLREMIALAGFGKSLDRNKIVQKVINDDPGQEGGFLYTPEREFYDGHFVLVPHGNNFDLIHRYAELIFHNREFYYEPATISILNATKEPGIARNTAYFLNRFGFQIESIDNEKDADGEKKYHEKSFIRYNKWNEDEDGNVIAKHQATLDAIETFVKGGAIPSDPNDEPEIDITIILGDDYEVF